MATLLQLAFVGEILYKSYDDKESERIELVKMGLRAPIAEMIYIKAWTEVLILALSVSISIIFICLVKACFSIFFYKSVVFEIMSNITPRYIIVCKEVLKWLTFGRKSLLKLMLYLAFCKQC